jgi:hypothetical protein
MTVAILLLACLVLAAAVVALGVALREVRMRVRALETRRPLVEEVAQRPSRDHGDDGLVTGASAPSSTSGDARAPSSTSGDARAPSSTSGPSEFVITRLGEESDEPAPVLETKLFADVVLREAVVKAASFAHGVRRGLSPANRNRIWFEMRREVKRARKERKAEEREAIREYRARRRNAVQESEAA